jgi:hypothetical protein
LTPSGPLKSTWEDYLNESIGSNGLVVAVDDDDDDTDDGKLSS